MATPPEEPSPTLAQQSRDRAERLVVDLSDAYGEFEVREDRWEQTIERYDGLLERFRAEANGGAGIWVCDPDKGVLLVRHEGDTGWSEPAGKREPGESFAETAVREVDEETGIRATIDCILEVTLVTHEAPDRPPLISPIVLFEGEPVDGTSLDPVEGEIAEASWWRESPESVLYEAVGDYPFPEG